MKTTLIMLVAATVAAPSFAQQVPAIIAVPPQAITGPHVTDTVLRAEHMRQATVAEETEKDSSSSQDDGAAKPDHAGK